MQCKAKAKSTQNQCRRRAVVGKEVCTVHGGLTPGGIASANWKHGRYSKYLPTNFRERYEAEISDPDLLLLNDEIGLLRTQLSIVLEEVKQPPGTESDWIKLQKKLAAFDRAQRTASGLPDSDDRTAKMKEVAELFDELREMIQNGGSKEAAWRRILALADSIRKLTESEQRRRSAGEYILQMHDVMALFDYTVNLINDIVTDPKERARLSDGLYKLSGQLDGAKSLA